MKSREAEIPQGLPLEHWNQQEHILPFLIQRRFRFRQMNMSAFTTLVTLKRRFVSWTWETAVSMARLIVLGIFSGVEVGSMLIVDEASGSNYTFGQPMFRDNNGKFETESSCSIPVVKLCVKREAFWLRLLVFADIGFAESYMLGDLECDDLVSFFRVCECPSL